MVRLKTLPACYYWITGIGIDGQHVTHLLLCPRELAVATACYLPTTLERQPV